MSRFPASDKGSRDKYRPRFHFSPEKNWMNDPNGPIYYNGSWHLFYQYNPYGDTWGNMHWGHAQSKDLVGWRHLPIALSPDRLGTIFSGSVVDDHYNTSGLFSGDNGGLAAVFTYFKWGLQRQGLAVSRDGGTIWEKFAGNPIIRNPFLIHFRDPKVFFHQPTGQWIMVIASGDRVRFYRSKNLVDWEYTGDFGKRYGTHGGVWECPDLFELAVDDGRDNKKWVLIVSVQKGAPNGGSGAQYFIGDFDGECFTTDDLPDSVAWLDFGTDNYAGVTFNNVPESDGRRIFIGWMSNWQYAEKTPTVPFRSAMTVPRELSLSAHGDKPFLVTKPIREISAIRTGGFHLQNEQIDKDRVVKTGELSEGVFEIAIEWETKSDGGFGIIVRNGRDEEVVIGCDVSAGRLSVDRTGSGQIEFSKHFSGFHTAPLFSKNGRVNMRILVDRCSIEIFAGDGRIVVTDLVFPRLPYDRLVLFSHGSTTSLSSLSIWGLAGAF